MDETKARSLVDRMMGAALLDVSVYEEVEADTTATGQASQVVGLVALASAVATVGTGVGAAIASIIGAYVGWMVWAGVTYLIGSKAFGGTATWGELLRTLGFAQTPGLLYILGVVPILGWFVRVVVGIWMLIAGVIAIRQALDFDTTKAVLTALLGWLCLVVLSGLAMVMGAGGLALFS